MNFADKCSLKKYTHKSILINNEIIELTQTYKYLGLTLDSSLTFIKHLSNLINTLNYKIYLLNKIRPFLTKRPVSLIGSMSPWVLPDRTQGTVRQYPGRHRPYQRQYHIIQDDELALPRLWRYSLLRN